MTVEASAAAACLDETEAVRDKFRANLSAAAYRYPWQYMFHGFDLSRLEVGWRTAFEVHMRRHVETPASLFVLLPRCPRTWDRFQAAQQMAAVAVADPWSDAIIVNFLSDLLDEWLQRFAPPLDALPN